MQALTQRPREVLTRSITCHRGVAQLYVDSAALPRSGFEPGVRFDVQADAGRGALVLRAQACGARRVSAKNVRDRVLGVIDVNNATDLAVLAGLDRVRVVLYPGHIEVLPLASEAAQRERLLRVLGKLARGEALAMASLAHGVGVMAHAAHTGLDDAGVNARLAAANEVDDEVIDHARAFNDAWSSDTTAVNLPMQELAQDAALLGAIGPVEVLEVGIPCSGASKAGRARNHNAMVEQHPSVGHLVEPILAIVRALRPALIGGECVGDWRNSASAAILRASLSDLGYDMHEQLRDAHDDDGCHEKRVRWYFLAVTRGIACDMPAATGQGAATLGPVAEILDDVPDDDPSWRAVTYLHDKSVRDAQAGKGFKMQLVSPQHRSLPTLRAGYYKGGSTDPRCEHPRRGGLSRLLTPAEHARAKQIPESLWRPLVQGSSPSTAHRLLGQSVAYPSVRAIFRRAGQALSQAASQGNALEALRAALRAQRSDKAVVVDAAPARSTAADSAGAGDGTAETTPAAAQFELSLA